MKANKTLAVLLILIAVCAVLFAATGDESVVLTSGLNVRSTEPDTLPVWEYVCTWTYDADDAGAETKTLPINGVLMKVIFTFPNTTTDNTTEQLLIKDNGDNTIFDTGEVAEGAASITYTYNLFEPVSGTLDITLEPSTYSGDAATTKVVTLRGI